MRAVLVGAPASGQGKTTVTLGLLRALRDRGCAVVSGKSGPDYIDPGYHRAATGRDCVTLDAWAADAPQLRARAAMQAQAGDLMVIEGAMGLHDGAPGGPGPGQGSSAALARALGVPVVLVIDISHMAQSVGAIVAGLANWGGGAQIAGVVLNRVGSTRHERLARQALGPDVPVLGAVPRLPGLALPSRHLGLVQAREIGAIDAFLTAAGAEIGTRVDLDAVTACARTVHEGGTPDPLPPPGQRIAVAADAAFGFAYWHQLMDWRAAGAEIHPFSPLADQGPDGEADAVFLPGGYPELHAGRLAGAGVFRRGMQDAAARGARIYGECGGYMVLGESLIDADSTAHPMLGLLPLVTSFALRRRHLGYRRLTATGGSMQGRYAGHEFHYATTVSAKGAPLFAVEDAEGADLGSAGLCRGNVMGSFMHIIERSP